jgi:hypothetical protein
LPDGSSSRWGGGGALVQPVCEEGDEYCDPHPDEGEHDSATCLSEVGRVGDVLGEVRTVTFFLDAVSPAVTASECADSVRREWWPQQ